MAFDSMPMRTEPFCKAGKAFSVDRYLLLVKGVEVSCRFLVTGGLCMA